MLLVLTLFTYVVSILDVFLNTLSCSVSNNFATDGISCAESSPYRSFDLSTASAVYTFNDVLQLLCLQKVSSFFMVAVVIANI